MFSAIFIAECVQQINKLIFLLDKHNIWEYYPKYVEGSEADIAPRVKLEAADSLINGLLFAPEVEFWNRIRLRLKGCR